MNLDAEIRATRGAVLGEAVWRRMCQVTGLDPKDERWVDERGWIVQAVSGAAQVMDEAGFEGLEDWLKMEEDFT